MRISTPLQTRLPPCTFRHFILPSFRIILYTTIHVCLLQSPFPPSCDRHRIGKLPWMGNCLLFSGAAVGTHLLGASIGCGTLISYASFGAPVSINWGTVIGSVITTTLVGFQRNQFRRQLGMSEDGLDIFCALFCKSREEIKPKYHATSRQIPFEF